MVKFIMTQANLLISYRGYAFLIAIFILNYVPNKSIPTTPYKLWTNQKLNLSILKPLGCVAFVIDTLHSHGKLSVIGKKCIFIRYLEHSKGYVFIGEYDSETLTKFE